MEKEIKIDIRNKSDLLHKYNDGKICDDVIEYIMEYAMLANKKDNFKIVVNKKCDFDEDVIKLIKDGLKAEYKKSVKEHHDNNKKQVVFFVLGIIFIFLSTLMKNDGIWKEIVLISGWVPLWEVMDVELFSDYEGRKKRSVINKLLNSEIIEKSMAKI